MHTHMCTHMYTCVHPGLSLLAHFSKSSERQSELTFKMQIGQQSRFEKALLANSCPAPSLFIAPACPALGHFKNPSHFYKSSSGFSKPHKKLRSRFLFEYIATYSLVHSISERLLSPCCVPEPLPGVAGRRVREKGRVVCPHGTENRQGHSAGNMRQLRITQ